MDEIEDGELQRLFSEWRTARLAYIANPDQPERIRLEAAQDAAMKRLRELREWEASPVVIG